MPMKILTLYDDAVDDDVIDRYSLALVLE